MVDDDNVHQQPANPSCLRINSTINSFFMTCHAGIRDTKLEGYEEKFTYKKIDVALQATLELEITAPLRSKVLISKNLKRRRKNSDLLITKLRSVVDVERKKVGDAKFELKCVVETHAKDVGVIQSK
ncbi:unnamed protein product [Prunus armeniaca]|uniref:Uncharacterized protein n=1 Tax=Prunus armeniaca TaxID=36596 RepID=A0A6J5Y630_PRUAR|nr:unnamed protein product [Prunus armeniaca]